MRTVASSTTSVVNESSPRLRGGAATLLMWSIAVATASASNAVPSWKTTSDRSANSHVVASMRSHDSARAGVGWPDASERTSPSITPALTRVDASSDSMASPESGGEGERHSKGAPIVGVRGFVGAAGVGCFVGRVGCVSGRFVDSVVGRGDTVDGLGLLAVGLLAVGR